MNTTAMQCSQISAPDFRDQEGKDEDCTCTGKKMVTIPFWRGVYSEEVLSDGPQNS